MIRKYSQFITSIKRIPANINIPNDIKAISQAYIMAGKDIFIVGGAVRDFLQKKIPKDWDLVTNALPEESKKILKDFNVSDEQGKNFGVLRVYTKEEPSGYEIASYRKDIASGRDTKGDDKKVEMGKHITIYDDIMRRDLTVNSLFYDIKNKEIVDAVGGVDDILNGVIKAVGDPTQRFNEDRLRILRVFRFCARTGGQIDEETSNVIIKDNRLRGISKKDDVSQERIIEEFNKVFEHAYYDITILQRYIDLLSSYDMWGEMFPGLKIHTNIVIDTITKPIVFLDIFNEEVKDKKRIFNSLTFPNDLINSMCFLQDLNNKNIFKLANDKIKYNISDNLILEYCMHKSMDIRFISAFIKYCNAGFEISGTDLERQGFKGADIRFEKERLENERFERDFR